jgi:hypothetical protein
MNAAYRLKGVGWLAASVAVVLGFYLVSLQVAAERKKLDEVSMRIRAAERDIRALETEFDTRANLAQLEKWNGDTLSLTAPVAAQFLPDEAALAAMDVRAAPAPHDGRTMTAALVVPSLPSFAPAPPVVSVQQVAVAKPSAPIAEASVIRVAAVRTPVAAPSTPAMEARRTERARAQVAVARVRPQAVAMLDRKLLSDTTLGDILSGARSEAGRRR